MGNKKKGKILAVLLCGALIGTQIPGMTVAEGAAGYTGGICEHHPVHTAECGYQEAVPEQACRHEHTKECYEYETSCVHVHTEECYPLIAIEVPAGDQDTEGMTETQTEWVRGSEPTACIHVCSEDSGCVTKTLNCIHEDKVNADGSITYAVHDASCGYAPAVEGKECTFVCEKSLSETETEALTVQTGIAAAGSADSEPSAKTTEAGDEGTDEDERDSETETSTEKTPEAGTEGTSAGTDSETEAPVEKTAEAGTEGTSAGETDPETEVFTEKTTETGIEGTEPDTEAAANHGPRKAPGANQETGADEAVSRVQALIDALPSVSEVEQMTKDEQKEVYDKAQDAADAYFDELSEEQQDQVDLKKLMDLMNYFNGQVSTMLYSGDGWEIDDSGVLTITSSAVLVNSSRFIQNKIIKSVIIKEGVEGSIGEDAFYACTNLTSVTIEEGATIESIGNFAFAGCSSLTSITIPNSVTSIGENAFAGCSSLTSITIPNSVTSIGNFAFAGCSSLTSITIPNSVTSIGTQVFTYCSSLTTVAFPATAPSVGNTTNAFWSQINFIIPETSIGTGGGQYNLSVKPWSQIKKLNGKTFDGGKYVIDSVKVDLTAPQAEQTLAGTVTCDTEGVSSYNITWMTGNEAVTAGTTAEFGTTYTAEVTLSANTEATPIGYKFTGQTTVTLKGESVTGTAAADGSTLTFTKTYQIPKQSQNSPVISIDYQNETLNTTADMEYRANEEEAWTTCTADMKAAALGWDGTAKTVQIRMKETANAYASDPASVTIPARPASPNIQADGSTASSINVQVAGVSQEEAVQYQLVADGGSIDSEKWQKSGEFTNLKADTSYTAYAKCGATTGSFASDTSSGQPVKTLAAAYTVTIPSKVIAGDSTSEAEISVDVSDGKSFDLGYNGQVQVKVESNGAVSTDGELTLTRQGASDTITSAMLVNRVAFTNINNPVATFTMSNYESAKAAISFAKPQSTGGQTVIPAGTYSGTVNFEVSYSD